MQQLLFPFLLVFYEIGAYLSNDMYLPALPLMMTDLHISAHETQLTLTAWFIGATSLQLIAGPLSDRFGRKPILIISGAIYIAATLACAVTHDFTLLLFARFIQGVTVSTAIVAGYASIHEVYDKVQAIRILAVMGSITILAPAFGPLMGSLILLITSWRAIFWIILVWATIATLALSYWMPESHLKENRHPLKLKSLGKNYFSIITNWQFTGLSLLFCLTFCGFIAWLAASPFIIIEQFGYSTVDYGIVQALVFISYIIATRFVKYLMEKMGVEKLVHLGLQITLTGGLLAALFAIIFPNSLSALVFAMMIYSFGCGFSFAPLNRLSIEASSEPMGLRIAVSSTYMSAFGTLGTVLITLFYNNSLGSLAYILAGTIVLAWMVKYSLRTKV